MSNQAVTAIIIGLAVFGIIIVGGVYAVKQFADVLRENPQPAWFMLGFGSCFLLEGIIWGVIRFIQKRFP